MDKVYSIVRKTYDREPTVEIDDFNVNVAIWGMFLNNTHQAAVHLVSHFGILSQEVYGVLLLPMHSNRIDCCLSLSCVRTEFVEVIRLITTSVSSSPGETNR